VGLAQKIEPNREVNVQVNEKQASYRLSVSDAISILDSANDTATQAQALSVIYESYLRSERRRKKTPALK
jgi:hypothetical protein